MQVWIVTLSRDDTYEVAGVFDEEEKAVLYSELFDPNEYEIEEMTLNEHIWKPRSIDTNK